MDSRVVRHDSHPSVYPYCSNMSLVIIIRLGAVSFWASVDELGCASGVGSNLICIGIVKPCLLGFGCWGVPRICWVLGALDAALVFIQLKNEKSEKT